MLILIQVLSLLNTLSLLKEDAIMWLLVLYHWKLESEIIKNILNLDL